jgi:cytochrome P450
MQEKLYNELKDIDVYTPEALANAKYLSQVLNETLRLTPSLYFLPRMPAQDKWVETSDGQQMFIPAGTHVFLYAWGANRHEDFWGVKATGYPALDFVPERWDEANMAAHGRGSKDNLHFGFGHGPRMCPGKHLGELEVALAVGAFVKMFKFTAVKRNVQARAAVSTKPDDGVDVRIELRNPPR